MGGNSGAALYDFLSNLLTWQLIEHELATFSCSALLINPSFFSIPSLLIILTRKTSIIFVLLSITENVADGFEAVLPDYFDILATVRVD